MQAEGLNMFCLQQNQKTALMRNTPFGSTKFPGYDF